MITQIKNNPNTPLVSICCLAYNHKKYIRGALDSFIKQETNFPFEVLINDDASTDGTTEILKEYQYKYPNVIKPIYHKENEYSKGIRGILVRNLFPCASGKYIALCEGDDYWIDPLKLQVQIDFLETHNEYAICYHRVEELNEINGVRGPEGLNTSEKEETYTIYDLAKKNLIHTPSVVFRKNAKLPDWLSKSPAGDYPIHMLGARNGLIKYYPQIMAVYRRHNTSIWSALNSFTRIKKWFIVLKYLIDEFEDEPKVRRLLIKQLLDQYEQFYNICLDEKRIEDLGESTRELFCFSGDFFYLWWNDFYFRQVSKALLFPEGVKKSVKHLIKEINHKF